MNEEDKFGQVTAAVGCVRLRFKKATEPPHGRLFVKCDFVGRGGSFFVPTPPAAIEGKAPAEVGNTPGCPATLPLSVQSKLVDITEASATSQDEGKNSAQVDFDNVAGDATGLSPLPTDVVVVDVDFTLETTKFDLTEQNLSILSTTEIKLQLCLCIGGDDAETVVGTASVPVADVLGGRNEWTDELALGTYVAPPQPDAETSKKEESAQRKDELDEESTEIGTGATVQDMSVGPLEFGGSTSTMRMTLLTNDETADYTVGAGSLWADGAEVTGVPEGWKVVPPPETERSAWNETIASILSGESRNVLVAARVGVSRLQ